MTREEKEDAMAPDFSADTFSEKKKLIDAQREWMLDQIDSGQLDAENLIYFKKVNDSHAHRLRNFIVKRRSVPESKEAKEYNATKKQIAKVEGFIKNIKDSIAKLDGNIKELGHLGAYYRSRTRDVQKLPPVELMHKPTYKKFIEEFGKQLPDASTKPIKLSKEVRLYESWPQRVMKEKMDEEYSC
jgi:hypothetical protein